MMDCALDGVKWWSIIRLEGYSRTMRAGAVAPAEASGGALLVLSTAWLRSGAPETVISDSGGAFISTACPAVCQRLGRHQEPIKSHKGQSSLHWMETHCNLPRRVFDYQCALTITPAEFERVHQTFLEIDNTTAPQGRLTDQFAPPIPLQVLGEAKGRLETAEELTGQLSRALCPRTTNR